MKTFFVLFCFLVPLFSESNFSTKIEELAQTKQWQRILHFKNNRSEIDDEKFFFSENGKTDPRAELEASIEQLIGDKSDDDNATLCRYPSRSHWILEQIPELKEKIFVPRCRGLNEEIEELGAKEVVLVLATAYMNSPASAFGHTFLRFDKKPNTPLLSYAVNYAAEVNGTKGFSYVYKGLFGGYKGRYSIDRYYKKLKEYSDLEQRDIWEYTLELSQKEIDRMVYHIFELRHFYSDYFFLAENCSYNLLWLLEVAKDDVNLINKFNHKSIPLDTLRVIVSEGLVKETKYRPSKRKEILKLSEPIGHKVKALEFLKSKDYDLVEIEDLTKAEKIASLELAIALLQIRLSKHEIEKEEYLANFSRLLKSRSKLGRSVKEEPVKGSSPLEGHYSTKSSIGYTHNKVLKLRTKLAYHDVYDNEKGYLSGEYINFLDTLIEYEDNKLKLEELNVLDIKSYSIQDSIFKPITWQVALGGKRIFNNELNAYLQVGGGLTLGNERFYVYGTITPTFYYRRDEELGMASHIGMFYNPSKDLKLGLLSSNEWFSKNRKILEVEPFITYSLNQESALNLRYEYKEMNNHRVENLVFSWFWYY